jgi:lysophospholipid acyltransferase (LPLAT)-like uncharacterized protein
MAFLPGGINGGIWVVMKEVTKKVGCRFIGTRMCRSVTRSWNRFKIAKPFSTCGGERVSFKIQTEK